MQFNFRNLVLLLLILIGAGVEFAQRYITLNFLEFSLIGIGLLIVVLIGNYLDKQIGATLGFFLLVHLTRYANEWVTEILGANFSGTYFLLPVVLFTLIIISFRSVRETIGWWKRDKIEWKLILQMAVVVAVGSIGMFLYLNANPHYLDRFLDMLPRGNLLKIITLGIVFALLNASVEEFIIRGMIWNGLEKIMSSPVVLIVTQAVIFGVSHYFGLPGGLAGMTMIFIWSLFIGYVRWKTGGLLGAIGLHFFANLAQFFMLYAFI